MMIFIRNIVRPIQEYRRKLLLGEENAAETKTKQRDIGKRVDMLVNNIATVAVTEETIAYANIVIVLDRLKGETPAAGTGESTNSVTSTGCPTPLRQVERDENPEIVEGESVAIGGNKQKGPARRQTRSTAAQARSTVARAGPAPPVQVDQIALRKRWAASSAQGNIAHRTRRAPPQREKRTLPNTPPAPKRTTRLSSVLYS